MLWINNEERNNAGNETFPSHQALLRLIWINLEGGVWTMTLLNRFESRKCFHGVSLISNAGVLFYLRNEKLIS